MENKPEPFFVGYLKIPKNLKSFLLKISLLLFFGFSAGAILAGATQDDPGQAGFRFEYGRQTVSGVIEAKPYPLLYVTEGNDRIKSGQTLMLSGQGKSGVMSQMQSLQGTMVKVTGILLNRGELQMLQLLGGKRGLERISENAPVPESNSIGKWRLQGEICDGKCLAGAMQPGRGLAHKACANLCIIGGIPPVFVSSQPVEGEEFLLIGNKDGGPLPETAYDFVGQFVEIEAEIERRGDMLVLLLDASKLSAIE